MNKWIESDWALRIASVTIAVVLWLIVTHSFPFQQDEQTTLRIDGVPVEIRYDADDYALQSVSQRQVQLTLTGDKKNLQSIPSYQVYVDLSDVKTGQHQQVPIQVSGLPRDIQVKVFPAHLTVFLDKKVEKEIPIRLTTEGALPIGYQLDQIQINPDHVLLKGTESQVKKISEAEAVINLNGIRSRVEKWVKLRVPNKRVHLSPETVKVTVLVKKPSKVFPITVNVSKQPPTGYEVERIELEPTTVTLYGEQSILQSILRYPPIQLDLSKAQGNQTISVKVPIVNSKIDVQPKEVKVKVYIKPKEE